MNFMTKCDVCGSDIVGSGYQDLVCKNCGWIQDEMAVKFPNKLNYPNITSLKNAKEMHKNGLKIKPIYEDFIEMVRMNLEPSFMYKKRRFGSTKFDGFEFYECDKQEGYQNYKTIEEFEQKVNIDGVLLKDIWQEIEDVEMC